MSLHFMTVCGRERQEALGERMFSYTQRSLGSRRSKGTVRALMGWGTGRCLEADKSPRGH